MTTSTTASPTSRSSWCAAPTTRSAPSTTRAGTGAPASGAGAARRPTARSPVRSTAGSGTSTARARSVLDPEEFGITSLDTPALHLGELRCECGAGASCLGVRRPRRPSARRAPRVAAGVLRPTAPRSMRFLWYRTTVLPANWKAALDAFHEGYHNYGTHPQLLQWSDDTAWYEQFDNGHAVDVTVRGAGLSKRFGMSADEWDDRELLDEQVMHLGKSFEGGLYSDDDMAAAARLRTMEIPEWVDRGDRVLQARGRSRPRARHRVPRAVTRAACRGNRRVLGVPEPGDAGEPGQLLHVLGPGRTATTPTRASSTCGRCASSRRRTEHRTWCATSPRTTTPSGV